MVCTKKLPKTPGEQFTAVYTYNSLLWSNVYRVRPDGVYTMYNYVTESFEINGFLPWTDRAVTEVKFVVEE